MIIGENSIDISPVIVLVFDLISSFKVLNFESLRLVAIHLFDNVSDVILKVRPIKTIHSFYSGRLVINDYFEFVVNWYIFCI